MNSGHCISPVTVLAVTFSHRCLAGLRFPCVAILAILFLTQASSASPVSPPEQPKPAEPEPSRDGGGLISVRVTRGPRHEPVSGAEVLLSKWLGMPGHRARFLQARVSKTTDSKGTVTFHVGGGTYRVSMKLDKWTAQQTIEVSPGDSVPILFDRPWIDKRTITGRLTHNQVLRKPTPATVIKAWSLRNPNVASDGVVLPDGRFSVEIDAAVVYLFATDSQERLSATGRLGKEKSTIDLEFTPLGRYSGRVVDASGKPLAGDGVQLSFKGGRVTTPLSQLVVQSTTCDEKGRFQFDSVPTHTPLLVCVGKPASAGGAPFPLRSPKFQTDATDEFYLEPGESRDNVELVVTPRDPAGVPLAKAESREPLEKRLNRMIRDVRLAGMRLLVILQGDDSKNVTEFTDHVLDPLASDEIVRFLPLTLTAEEIRAEAPVLSRFGWEPPKAGEVGLIAIDGTGANLAAERFSAEPNDTVDRETTEFLKHNAPPQRNAPALLETARQQARDTNRRLWIIRVGPRCSYCFQLVRWMDDQRSLLAKDYVVVTVSQIDQREDEVLFKLHAPEQSGLPWFAIAEPDGTILATSDGPLGNIGFPATIEDIRHLKSMLDHTARHLTPADREHLVKSLSPNR